METHPIESLMKSTLENLKAMIDVNTVIGDPIKSHDGTLIIPISKVSLGFASGGSEFSQTNSRDEDSKYPFGGGSGSGVSVKPVAFLVIQDSSIRLIPVDQQNINIFDRLLDQIPNIINLFKKSSSDENNSDKYKYERRETEEE